MSQLDDVLERLRSDTLTAEDRDWLALELEYYGEVLEQRKRFRWKAEKYYAENKELRAQLGGRHGPVR